MRAVFADIEQVIAHIGPAESDHQRTARLILAYDKMTREMIRSDAALASALVMLAAAAVEWAVQLDAAIGAEMGREQDEAAAVLQAHTAGYEEGLVAGRREAAERDRRLADITNSARSMIQRPVPVRVPQPRAGVEVHTSPGVKGIRTVYQTRCPGTGDQISLISEAGKPARWGCCTGAYPKHAGPLTLGRTVEQ